MTARSDKIRLDQSEIVYIQNSKYLKTAAPILNKQLYAHAPSNARISLPLQDIILIILSQCPTPVMILISKYALPIPSTLTTLSWLLGNIPTSDQPLRILSTFTKNLYVSSQISISNNKASHPYHVMQLSGIYFPLVNSM